jgi:hypothetical protein
MSAFSFLTVPKSVAMWDQSLIALLTQAVTIPLIPPGFFTTKIQIYFTAITIDDDFLLKFDLGSA